MDTLHKVGFVIIAVCIVIMVIGMVKQFKKWKQDEERDKKLLEAVEAAAKAAKEAVKAGENLLTIDKTLEKEWGKIEDEMRRETEINNRAFEFRMRNPGITKFPQ